MILRRGIGNVRAIPRAAILLTLVLDVPVLTRVVTRLTREPRVDRLEIEGVPFELVRPGSRGPWPAFVFVTGAHPLRRKEPIVQRLARGLARAGYVCLVPDLPGLGEGQVTPQTLDAAVAVIEAALARSDVCGGRVALCGASTGASLALLAAARPQLADRISVVAAVTPFADLQRIVCLATTSSYAENGEVGQYAVTGLLRRSVARSLCAALASRREGEALLAHLSDESDEADPLEPFVRLDVDSLSPDAQAVVRLLVNREAGRFRELYGLLPPTVLSIVSALSPLATADRVGVPVEIVVPPTDIYFPLGEAVSLAHSLPNGRLTVTGTLDHTRPTLSLRRVPDLLRFEGFVVRSLAAAL